MKLFKAIKKRLKKLWKSKKFRRRLKYYAPRITLAVSALIAILWFSLPDIENLDEFARAPSVVIKASDGQIIGSSGNIYGDYVKFNDLPKSLIDAVIATEDRRFYSHFGIDIFGIIRASFANMRAGRIVQGASTITQQVAKNVFLTPERRWSRKIREMLLALKLEARYSKNEIMSIYLNRIYLGAGNYGVDAASRRYFGKSARDLTLTESAILAGMPQAPSRYAPNTNPKLALKRAEQVLEKMVDAEFLTEKQHKRALQDLTTTLGNRQRDSQNSFYFSDWVMEQLPEYVGKIEEDIVVSTTFDPEMQLLAEKAIASIMDDAKKIEPLKVKQAALVAMAPDGAVRAMMGGRNYASSQYNRATQAERQPGSSFKLFVYLAALEAGLTPESMMDDSPITLPIVGGTWTPKNYTGKYTGPITLKQAVTESINTVAVQASQFAGLTHVIDVAYRLGITSHLIAVPSIALGATEATLIEMTGAYAHLASGGIEVKPYGISRIETSSGAILYVHRTDSSDVMLRRDVVGNMNEMLMNVVQSGTGRAAIIGRPVAGKTGTTSDYRDAWFIGFAPQLVTGVWVGNDDNSAMKKVTGGMLPAQIWHNFMQPALAGEPVEEIPVSAGDVPAPMPWQQDRTQESSQPTGDFAPQGETESGASPLPWEREDAPAPIEQRDIDAPAEKPKKRSVELSPSFWDKLGSAQR